MRKIILLIGLLTALNAWPIGRSGNGTISSSWTGFSAQAPDDFGLAEASTRGRLRLFSTVLDARPEMFVRPFIELGDAEIAQPENAKLNRVEMRERARVLGWEAQATDDHCVDAYIRHSEDGDLLAVYWGVGKGVVAFGPHSPYVRIGERQLLNSLRLEPGACAW